MNVQHWLIRTTCLLLAASLLSGCASFGLFGTRVKPVQVQIQAQERPRLAVPDPMPLKVRPVEWILITPDNAEQIFSQIREKNADLVLFGLTDDGYESLSVTMAELRNHIAAQRQIIIRYREYYEPVAEPVNK